jgi:anti-sigma B factor antagonist
MQSPFALDAEVGTGGAVRLRVSGELDMYTAPLLTEAVQTQARSGQRVIVDLEKVSFMDSTGVSALIGAIQDAARHDWQLAVARRLSPEVSRVMQLSGLQPLLDSIASDEP